MEMVDVLQNGQPAGDADIIDSAQVLRIFRQADTA